MLRLASTVFATLIAGVASAQQTGTPQPGSPPPARANQAQTGQIAPAREQPATSPRITRDANYSPSDRADHFDSHVADCLLLKNQEEVALLKFGRDRSKNSQVKELAGSMIKDHEMAISNLRKFASKNHANDELTSTQSRDSAVVTREARKVNADEAPASGAGGQEAMGEKMHRIAHRTAQECLALNKEEMSKWQGEEFDQAFLGSQIGAHIGMLAHLKALNGETSSELNGLISKMEATTQGHKQHLEKLMTDISKESHAKK